MARNGQLFAVALGERVPPVFERVARNRRHELVTSLGSASLPVCLVVVDADDDIDRVRERHPHALIAGLDGSHPQVDLQLPRNAAASAVERLYAHASALVAQRLQAESDLVAQHGRVRQLTEMAQALAGERDPARLLERILTEGRRLAQCEGGSLYLIDHENATPALNFKLVQNDAVDVTFEERRLHITATSLAGYVALTGEELNIPDAYAIDADRPYRFNADFDRSTGYRSRSILVLPMRDHRAVVVGVLQFINRRIDGEVVAFDDETTEVLRAVGSQAAIAIQKNRLISDIRTLFEQFVQASVKAIERRDPTTSGHSFRVAQTTVSLFAALPRSGIARFRGLELSEENLTEVRYAALLHDFGKVGVREAVLVKSHKLPAERLEILNYRFELEKERLRSQALRQEIELLHHGAADYVEAKRQIRAALAQQEARLDRFFSALVEANDPQVTPRATASLRVLDEIGALPFKELDGRDGRIVTQADLQALSVARGSLTAAERAEIQQHVAYTRDFLAVLPWPPELARVPLIAAAHHEKLDGSGYPLGLVGEEIPLASRVMTVCDIYDALTAMDRPYKPALPHDRALAILEEEVHAGMLDADIVSVFMAAGAYRATA